MSIKLYNGYIIRGKTIEEMYPKLLEASDYVFLYLEREVLRYRDNLLERAGGNKSMQDIRVELERLCKTYCLDADSSLVLIPDQGDILVLLFGGRMAENLYFSKLPELEDYHYQNQTDPPEYLSEDEWDEREGRWARVLRDWNPPSRVGLTLENSFEQVSRITWMPPNYTVPVAQRHFPEIDKE